MPFLAYFLTLLPHNINMFMILKIIAYVPTNRQGYFMSELIDRTIIFIKMSLLHREGGERR